MIINLKLTIAQAEAVAIAIEEHIGRRGDVRHYVDTRYSTADVEFRNYKIGQVQERFNRLNYVLNAIKLQGAEHESD
jgi:HAMP domain-containing protein